MKKAKKIFSLTLVMAMFLQMLPVISYAQEISPTELISQDFFAEHIPIEPITETVQYSVSTASGEWITVEGIENGQIMFDAETGTITDAELTITVANIPEQINGVDVIAIGDNAFHWCEALITVSIPENVREIGDLAFYNCFELVSVEIPDSVTTIGIQAFGNCYKLASITIPEGLTTLARGLFSSCSSLTEIDIPENVTYIDSYVFSGCSKLQSVVIPTGIKNIEDGTFSDCDNLTSVTIPDSVTKIGEKAFYQCTSLVSIVLPEGVTHIDDWAFYKSGLTSFKVPLGVKQINENVFRACNDLISVELHSDVQEIERYAFYDCPSLKSISMPEGLTEIGQSAFSNVAFETAGPIGGGYDYEFAWTTSIPSYAFDSCKSLISVEIPDSIATIGAGAFSYCTSLKSIELPNDITSIGYMTFANSGLESISIPDKVVTISNSAFSNCHNLISVTIPEGVTSLGPYSFMSCSNLLSIELPTTLTSVSYETFKNCKKLTSINIPEGVEYIGDETFLGCTDLSSITIPSTVKRIGNKAFSGCASLESIVIPEGVEEMEYGAFFGTENLKNVSLPESFTEIDRNFGYSEGQTYYLYRVFESAFETAGPVGSGSDLEFAWTDEIPDHMFEEADSLKFVVIPEGMSRIGEGAFYQSENLISATIPASVTEIGENAFINCHDDLILYIVPNSIADIYAAENGIDVEYLAMGAYFKITLPLDGDFDGMTIRLSKTGESTAISTTDVTDSLTYTMGGLDVGTTYKLELLNLDGEVIASTDNITVIEGENAFNFTDIQEDDGITLSVKTVDDTDVTEDVIINWYDENENELTSLSNLAIGTEIYYEILLNETLGKQYIEPEMTKYTIIDGENNITVTLAEFESITVSGRVLDENDSPISNATVTIRQTLGRYSENIVVNTSSDGTYSADIKKVPSTITASYDGYINGRITKNDWTETTLSDISLELIRYALDLRIIYTDSVLPSEMSEDRTAIVGENLSFSLYNNTKNAEITDFSVQFPTIVLPSDVAIGDEIRVTVNYKDDAYSQAIGTAPVSDSETATIDLNMVEQGYFQIEANKSSNGNDVAIVYDSFGNYVGTYDFVGLTAYTTRFESGEYTIISMAKNDAFSQLPTLTELDSVGLVSGVDYTKNTATVENGKITTVSVGDIASFDETKFYYTDIDKTSFIPNKSSVVAGRPILLRSEFDFKEEHKDKVSDVSLIVKFPRNIEFYSNSLTIDGEIVPYSYSNNTLKVSLENASDIARFYVTPTFVGDYNINVFVEFNIEGEKKLQPLSTTTVAIEDLTVNVPPETGKTNPIVSGVATPNATLKIFDNGEIVKSLVVPKDGSWYTEIDLIEPGEASDHLIHVEIESSSGVVYTSDKRYLRYNEDCVDVSKVTMYTSDEDVVFDFENPENSNTYYDATYLTDVTFVVDFSDNNSNDITDANLFVYTLNGETKILDITKDAGSGKWIATGNFSGDAPQSIAIDYGMNTNDLPEYKDVIIFDDASADLPEVNDYKVLEDAPNSFSAEITTDEGVFTVTENVDFTENLDKSLYEEIKLSTGENIYFKEVFEILANGEEMLTLEVAIETKVLDVILEEHKEIGEALESVQDTIDTIEEFQEAYEEDMRPGASGTRTLVLTGKLIGKQLTAVDDFDAASPRDRALALKQMIECGIKNGNLSKDSLKKLRDDIDDLVEKTGQYKKVDNMLETADDIIHDKTKYPITPAGLLRKFTTPAAGLVVDEKLNHIEAMVDYAMKIDGLDCKPKLRTPSAITPIIDPSGYVYEAVPSNRIEGVTTTAYELVNGSEVMWDAEQFGQINPLITDDDGRYAWDVPMGLWKVTYEKDGYETTDSTDDPAANDDGWLPVPPPQTEVNVGMISKETPTVSQVVAYPDGVEITFSKYMDITTLTNANITVSSDGTAVTGTISLLNAEENPVYKVEFASKVKFTPTENFAHGAELEIAVNTGVKSYADVAMASVYSVTKTVDYKPESIDTSAKISAVRGEASSIKVTLLPKEAVAGKSLTVKSSSNSILGVPQTVVVGQDGVANIAIDTKLPGTAFVTVSLEGTELSASTEVNISMTDTGTEDPKDPDDDTGNQGGSGGGGGSGTGSVGDEEIGDLEEEEAGLTTLTFSDVSETDWFYEAVKYAAENGLFNGTSEDEFSPNIAMNRAMIWTVLARAEDVDTTGGAEWYSVGMQWAIESDVSDGTEPMGNLTREQLVTMLYRYAGSPVVDGMLNYPDDDLVSDWAYEAFIWAVDKGIITGMDDGKLAPQVEASRAQVATILMRYLEME